MFQDELKELKQLVGSKIDYGNRMLSLDVVARDENGAPISPKRAGVMHLHKVVCPSHPQSWHDDDDDDYNGLCVEFKILNNNLRS